MTGPSSAGNGGDLGAAFGLLTILGAGRAPRPGAVAWFPVVGAVVGGAVGALWWGAHQLWGPLVAAVVAVGADLILTGALHHDGLADAADGLLPHLERERRLEVMRTPEVGTFAVMVLVTTTLVRVAALASIEPHPLVVAGVWCLARTAMVATMRVLPYARAQGLASSLLAGPSGPGPLPVAAIGLVLGAALLVPAGLPVPATVAAVAALVVASVGVAGLARRRIGGFTGDVLGAVCVMGETAALLTLAARW